jgi:hypothetical protein
VVRPGFSSPHTTGDRMSRLDVTEKIITAKVTQGLK